MVYREVLDKFTNICHRILGENLVGVYLHGSAAMGCFQPMLSDLDLIAVVEERLADAVKLAFLEEVADLNEIAPAKGIEMSIVRRQFCNPFTYPTPFELHFSVSHLDWYREASQDYVEKMKGVDKDLAAHFTILIKYGIVLWGERIEAVFGNVPPENYRDSICCDVENAAEDMEKNPMYMTLNLCRVLAHLREGKILSKRQGGEWGLAVLPGEFGGIIREALDCYGAGREMKAKGETPGQFAAYMTKEIQNLIPDRKAVHMT